MPSRRSSMGHSSGGTAAEEEERSIISETSIVSAPVKVLLADDHTMFREGLTQSLTSYGGMEVVGEGPNDEAALMLAQEKKPDVVIMQVQIPFERAKDA